MKKLLKITTDEHRGHRFAPIGFACHTELSASVEVHSKSVKSWIKQALSTVAELIEVTEGQYSRISKTNPKKRSLSGVEMTTFTISRYFDKLSDRVFILALSLLIITLSTSCSQKFPKGNLFELIILRKLLSVSTVATATTTTTTPTVNNNKYIFLTAIRDTNFGGVSGADTYCQSQKTASFASLAGDATEYKAFLVDGTNRRACSTNNCSGGITENINWVLKANTDYYRLDGTTDTKLFITNSAGIINFTGGSTLLAAIDSSSSTSWWTGMDDLWVKDFSCTSNLWGGAGQANKGVGGTLTSISTILTTSCGNTITNRVLCVRQ